VWENLGTFDLAPTSDTLTVRLSGSTSGNVIIDAVRIERVTEAGETVPYLAAIDNGDAGVYASSGFTSYASGYQGDLQYAARTTNSTPTATATWDFGSVPAGTYRVSATWVPHSNRATNAPYAIEGGPTILVNQEKAPSDPLAVSAIGSSVLVSGTWFADLMVAYEHAGGPLRMTLGNNANEYVIADAVRVEEVSGLRSAIWPGTGANAGNITRVSPSDAAATLTTALGYWATFDPPAVDRLPTVQLVISDLPGRLLGVASERTTTLWLDRDAAGYGWHLTTAAGPTVLAAGAEMDLLGVLAHETGHLLGHGHDEADELVVMAPTLTARTLLEPSKLIRGQMTRTPAAYVDAVFAELGRQPGLPDDEPTDQSMPSRDANRLTTDATVARLVATRHVRPTATLTSDLLDRLARGRRHRGIERALEAWFAALDKETGLLAL
jgi:hypothetical protein